MSRKKENQTDHINLDRRELLKTGAMGAAILAVGSMACNETKIPEKSDTPKKTEAFDLEETTIAELRKGIKDGRLTARAITERYLKRISEIDKNGPAVNAVLEINPDALAIADELDREYKTSGPRGPLHGIPVFIKANIDTADKMPTTAGSLALAGSIAQRDAFIVERLRNAGAVLLGKTNLSEWANFRSTRSSSGWSSLGGQTLNPYALDRNPCGSSSGSGVAAAANLCTVAIGTETDGSVVCPSNANSIVGIKPTIGIVSRSGIIPIAHSQDTAGPMARTVEDAAILLGVMAGADPNDAVTTESRGKSPADYVRFLDPNGLKGARIGVARNFFGFHEQVDRLMNEAVDVMKRLGAEIIDPSDIETAGKFGDAEYNVLLYEFKENLNKYLAGLGPRAPVKSLQEIIVFNEKNRDRVMPYFEQEIFHKAQEKGPLTSKEYLKALDDCRQLAQVQGIDATVKKHSLDAIVAPTGGPPWMTDLVNGDHFLGGSSSAAAVSGCPNITVPAGYVFGLPVGISFFSSAFREPKLIALAYAFEQATHCRKPPQFLPSAQLTVQ